LLVLLTDLFVLLKVFNLINIHMALMLVSGSTPLTPPLKLFFSLFIRLLFLVYHLVFVVFKFLFLLFPHS
jgi:hypothetical protein